MWLKKKQKTSEYGKELPKEEIPKDKQKEALHWWMYDAIPFAKKNGILDKDSEFIDRQTKVKRIRWFAFAIVSAVIGWLLFLSILSWGLYTNKFTPQINQSLAFNSTTNNAFTFNPSTNNNVENKYNFTNNIYLNNTCPQVTCGACNCV